MKLDVAQIVPNVETPEPPDYLAIKESNDTRIAMQAAVAAAEAAIRAAQAKAAEEEAAKLQAAQIASQRVTMNPINNYTPVSYAAAPVTAPVAAPPTNAAPGLTGSYGYALAGGNCVAEPGVNNPGQGNPITWPVLYSEPAIGRTALFTYNHVARITGLWSNGDVEVAHRNWNGAPVTRFPRSAFRGFR